MLGLTEAANAFAPLRAALPGATLIAWTPGVLQPAYAALAGADYVVPSLPWWDGVADWFWDECRALRQVAPLLACPEAPFGTRLAATVHDPARLAATLRRAAGLACMVGDGWLVPAGFETGARRKLDRQPEPGSVYVDLAAMNARIAEGSSLPGEAQPLTGAGAAPLALLHTDAADARFATTARLALLNTDVARSRTHRPGRPSCRSIGRSRRFEPFEARPPKRCVPAVQDHPGARRAAAVLGKFGPERPRRRAARRRRRTPRCRKPPCRHRGAVALRRRRRPCQ